MAPSPEGAFHRLLERHAGVRPFKLTQILRQQDTDYLAAAKFLSEGKSLEGLDLIQAKGWVHEIGSDEERYRRMAADYVASVQQGKSVLVVSPTHAEAASITEAIRSGLREQGLLGQKERSFTRLVAADATESRAEPTGNLPAGPGDPVLPEREAGGRRLHQGRSADGGQSGIPPLGRSREIPAL